ncbi:MAG: sn-glycerol-3-phosphate ABC transporter ATP-binding protein UgpC [bacterium]|nr:sn-glycerol-3-phosphate ABC transporter ATP-binding protein UgpC [bacterium]
MSEVILKNVGKIYPNKVEAVRDVSLTIEDKEFVVFVGPSGCGKSTLLRCIAGLEEVTSGEIIIERRVVNDIHPKDRDIAMVFQNYALYPHMNVYDNISFGLKTRGYSKDEIHERVMDAVRILGIEEYLKSKPRELSGGQRQRVAIGRAIVRHPKVFLFDEPLSNLDAKMRVSMRSEISKLHKTLGVTMIYVTHDQTEAMTMGDRIVVIDRGEIRQVADPHTLYFKPENLFTASFIGSPQMNVFPGKIKNKSFQGDYFTISFKNNIPDVESAVIGVRPEDISLTEGTFKLKGEVDLAESLGDVTFLHVKLEKQLVIIKTTLEKRFSIGEEISFFPNADKMHLFGSEDGKRIEF